MVRFMHRIGAVVGLVAALALFSGSVFAQSLSDIDAKKKISIGVLTGIPPYDTVDASGNTDGFLVELAKGVAQVKDLDSGTQQEVALDRLAAALAG